MQPFPRPPTKFTAIQPNLMIHNIQLNPQSKNYFEITSDKKEENLFSQVEHKKLIFCSH